MISLRTSKIILATWYVNKPNKQQFIISFGVPLRISIMPNKSIKKRINAMVARMRLSHCTIAQVSPSSHERN